MYFLLNLWLLTRVWNIWFLFPLVLPKWELPQVFQFIYFLRKVGSFFNLWKIFFLLFYNALDLNNQKNVCLPSIFQFEWTVTDLITFCFVSSAMCCINNGCMVIFNLVISLVPYKRSTSINLMGFDVFHIKTLQ